MIRIVAESHIPYLQGVLEPWAQVTYAPVIDPHVAAEADILLVRTRTRCDASLLQGSHVRFIGTATIGTDHIDMDYCHQEGITVVNAPGCNAPAVAQWTLAAIGQWMQVNGFAHTHNLTLGVVGVGHVGSIVARWAQQLGFNVLLNDPPRAEREPAMATLLSPLARLVDECDIITFHTPLTHEGPYATWHLCNKDLLSRAQRCRLVLNAARGAVADNAALEQWPGDVAIDCWENEPQINAPLLKKALIATPHIAGYSRQGKQRATTMMLQALNNHFGWQIPIPVIDAPAQGASHVSLHKILDSYDIMADSALLKANPCDFEALRNRYTLRSEVVD